METLVAALLMSPGFLYLEEPVDPSRADGNLVPLRGEAVATRLSLLLWSSIPDDELLDAAQSGELDDADGVAAQVARMIEDERFDRTLESFHEQWLSIDNLVDLDPGDPSLAEGMRTETMTFVRHIYRSDDASLATLLSGSFSFVDGPLAALYGVDPPAEPFGMVELDSSQRRGILTHASVLTQTGAVFPEVHRGLFVREHLLCGELPLPDDSIELDPEVDRLETAPCSGCHVLMDPIGHGFDRYDAMGRYRETRASGDAISDKGELAGVAEDHVAGVFHGVPELASRLSDSAQVEHCMGVKWARYATGRHESEADTCALDVFADDLARSGGDLRQLLTDIATSEWFRSRSVEEF
jgi:hypothetical protein